MPSDEAHTYWNGSFSQRQQRDLLCSSAHSSVRDLFDKKIPCGHFTSYLTRYLAFDQRYYLTDDLLQKVDRMSMAHSLEVRPPYLDHRILEFAASLPDHLKIDGRKQKVVLKDLMRGKLPESVMRRPKIGLDIPTHDWFRGPLRPLLEETLSEAAIEQTGLFRTKAVRQLLADHVDGRANLGFHLWGLLVLFLWIKQWQIGTNFAAEQQELATSLATNSA